MPLVIGVTGPIASGKSLVCRTLVELGAELWDAEQLRAHGCAAEPARTNGSTNGHHASMSDGSGTIDRELARRRAALPVEGSAVIEVVDLGSPGYAACCDAIWLVACDEETAVQRLMARDGLGDAGARTLLAAEPAQHACAVAADLVLRNTSTREELADAVRYAFRRLWELYRSGALPRSRDGAINAANVLPVVAAEPAIARG